MSEPTYADIRARLEDGLRDLVKLGEQRPETPVADAARSLLKKLDEELFNVVVVGEFKRGKTTFVNALLGADVLPTAVVPLTSIVTAVTWGEDPRAEVSYLDGRIEAVTIPDLPSYVTERENPANRLGVDRAIVYYPAEELRDGVFLVDTPGVGSIYQHNTEAAYAFIPQSDAVVFLTSSDPPISDGERALLQDVRAEVSRMFFVLNKVDYLSEPDRVEALAFTCTVITGALGSEPKVYPVSARQALAAKLEGDEDGVEASGLGAFERDFRRFLVREKGAVILDSVAGQARKLVADIRNSLDIEERALQIPLEVLASSAEEMETVFGHALESREDVRTLLRREAEKLVRLVEDDLALLRREVTADLQAEARAAVAEHEDVRGLGADLDRLIKDLLRRRIERWRTDEERRIGDAFREATSRFVAETNALVERTIRLSGELLEVQLASVAAPECIAPHTRFTYSFFEAPTILESLLPDMSRLLPSGLARKRLLADIRDRVPDLVEKHCGRLRWDFVQRLDSSRLALERELDARLDLTIQSLRLGVRRALVERSRSEADALSSLAQMEADRRLLEAIDAAFMIVRERAQEGTNAL
jgi:signal recognition particle receptor subunit beta